MGICILICRYIFDIQTLKNHGITYIMKTLKANISQIELWFPLIQLHWTSFQNVCHRYNGKTNVLFPQSEQSIELIIFIPESELLSAKIWWRKSDCRNITARSFTTLYGRIKMLFKLSLTWILMLCHFIMADGPTHKPLINLLSKIKVIT